MDIINTTPTFNPTAQPTSTPDVSLATSVVMVEWNVSKWSGRKKDKRASAELASRKQAKSSAVSVNKALIECDELKAIDTFVGAVRNNYHYKYSLPWSDSGLRIVSTGVLADYTKQMSEYEQEFYRLVKIFLDHYQWTIQSAHINLGELFNPNEYPSLDEVSRKFAFRVNYMPLPATGDIRIDVAQELKDQMQQQYAEFYEQQTRTIMDTVWNDLYEQLKHMSDRLDFAGDEKKKKIYESTVEDLRRMVSLLDKYNFTNDSKMTKLQRDLSIALDGTTADALRANESYRLHTKQQVDDAIKTLGLGW